MFLELSGAAVIGFEFWNIEEKLVLFLKDPESANRVPAALSLDY
jgi:hypothetical protein